MKSKSLDFIKELLTFAAIALVIVIPIRMFIAQPFIVSGESMHPTFETGQYLIVDQLSYRFNEPERGEIIIFNYPKNPSKFFIKRIIGLPGETISIEGNQVYIINNDTKEKMLLDEPYVVMKKESDLETTLTDDEYFVMGDNRLASLDSRVWGPLERDFILGRAFARLLPLNKIDITPGSYVE